MHYYYSSRSHCGRPGARKCVRVNENGPEPPFRCLYLRAETDQERDPPQSSLNARTDAHAMKPQPLPKGQGQRSAGQVRSGQVG